MNRQLLLIPAGVAVAFLIFRRRPPLPVSLEKLEYSKTARAMGLPNNVPAGLLPVAKGLAVMGGEGIAAGWQFGSAYRAPALNVVLGGVSNSLHTRCQAIDFDTKDGVTVEKVRAHPVLGVGIQEILDEGDHVHVGWTRERLLEVGAK